MGKAINRLNPGKSNGNGGLKTNHFISALNDLAVYIYIYVTALYKFALLLLLLENLKPTSIIGKKYSHIYIITRAAAPSTVWN